MYKIRQLRCIKDVCYSCEDHKKKNVFKDDALFKTLMEKIQTKQ